MKELTKLDQRDLKSLAKQINDRQQTIEKAKQQAFGAVNSALAEAILQGQDLIKAKATVPHGLFLEWLKVNCPKVGARQAQKYMRIAEANANRGSFLNEADSIRSALLLCDDIESAGTEKQPKQWPPYLEGIYRFGKALGFIKDNPIESWPDEGKDKLRDDLEQLGVAKALWPAKFA